MVTHLLKDQAERCIQLAYQCQSKRAETVMRLLAVDLMLAAEAQRPRRPEPSISQESFARVDRFAELEKAMHAATVLKSRTTASAAKALMSAAKATAA